MDGARLDVTVEAAPIGPRGADAATLLLAANAGIPPAPLTEVASGGELSRIALAVRLAALERRAAEDGSRPLPTLLLDEIDAGVGGLTAHAVGEKLERLSAAAQILCITHLPQIAGRAEAHFRVEKTAGRPTTTTVERLGPDEVVEELTRMLGGGPDDDAARRHAVALRG